jgi:glycosyltransferase involved in cell wall biosynthesis
VWLGKMEVVVDGIIYEMQSRGGISRLYTEILPRMCAMDDSLQISLLTTGRCRQPLPNHGRIHHRSLFPGERMLRPWRLWWPIYPQMRALVQQLSGIGGVGKVWHSTYYTRPMRWIGPTVVTVVDMIHERFSHWFNTRGHESFRRLKKQCVSMADKVICISHTTQQDVQSLLGVDPQKTEVVSLACSDSFRVIEAPAGLAIASKSPYLLYVGMRSHYKNFAVLLEAFSRWDRRTELRLAIVGPPWSGEERQRLEALDIADRVHLLEDVDDERLCLLYNQASAFVYPSLFEGFGVPLLEAMSCGCPIIASRIPSTLEVAQECPIYFEPTEPEDLITAFDIAVADGRDSDRVRLGLQIVQCFSWDATAQQILEVYRAVSSSH